MQQQVFRIARGAEHLINSEANAWSERSRAWICCDRALGQAGSDALHR